MFQSIVTHDLIDELLCKLARDGLCGLYQLIFIRLALESKHNLFDVWAEQFASLENAAVLAEVITRPTIDEYIIDVVVYVRARKLLKIIQGAGTQPLDVVSADRIMHEALCQLLSPNVVVDR